jgi:hypothetical protein
VIKAQRSARRPIATDLVSPSDPVRSHAKKRARRPTQPSGGSPPPRIRARADHPTIQTLSVDYRKPIAGPKFNTSQLGEVTAALAFNPNGQTVAIGGTEKAGIYSVHGGLIHTLQSSGEVKSAAFSRDGQKVALLVRGDEMEIDRLEIFETTTGHRIDGIDTCGDNVSFLRDGSILVEGIMTDRRFGDSIVAYDGETLQKKDDLAFAGDGACLDGDLVLANGRVWDAVTEKSLTPKLDLGHLRAASLGRSGKLLAVSSGAPDELLAIFDTTTRQVTKEADVRAQGLQIAPDGQHLLTLEGPGDPTSWAIRDLETLEPSFERSVPGAFRNARLSVDGRQLIAVGVDGGVQSWRFE